MKKLFCLVLCLALLTILLSSCGGGLPSGTGTIYRTGGGWWENVKFKYINESTVKITDEDGSIVYVPTHEIESIWVNQK